jgi:ribosomal protein S18 acetylase RimI-like enzyme
MEIPIKPGRKINITLAKEKDIPSLVELINSAYRGESSKIGWTTEADLLGGQRTDADMLLGEMKIPDGVFLKYEDENRRLLGTVYLRKEDHKMYLGMLTVSPFHQDKGIGKQLLHAATQFARFRGCNRIFMTVISVRKELIAWYERHGYRLTGERKPFHPDEKFGLPTRPLEFVVLEKRLMG